MAAPGAQPPTKLVRRCFRMSAAQHSASGRVPARHISAIASAEGLAASYCSTDFEPRQWCPSSSSEAIEKLVSRSGSYERVFSSSDQVAFKVSRRSRQAQSGIGGASALANWYSITMLRTLASEGDG